ncbi:hypothetical protein F5Y02DRAFT_370708 [Annulohypoxylon stygium]|nr:hypothetical protein F5Y02DRAFT_370708 [Annulohypoxylon stygium]
MEKLKVPMNFVFDFTKSTKDNVNNYLNNPRNGNNADNKGSGNKVHQTGIGHDSRNDGISNISVQRGQSQTSCIKGNRNRAHQEVLANKNTVHQGDGNRVGQVGRRNNCEIKGHYNTSSQLGDGHPSTFPVPSFYRNQQQIGKEYNTPLYLKWLEHLKKSWKFIFNDGLREE